MLSFNASTKVFVAGTALLLAASLPISVFAVQEIVVTTKDAEIRQNNAANNYGAELIHDVRVQKSSSNIQNRRAIVGFDFTSGDFLGCTVDSATFEMFLQAANANRTYDVHPLTGAWAENTVTWTSAGSLTSGALASSASVIDGTSEGAAVSWTGLASLAQSAIDNSAELTLRVKDRTEAITGDSNINVFSQFTSREGAAVLEPPANSFAPRLVLELTCDECELWDGETAWAAGDRYQDPGNWATYTAYAADNTVTLYAGQTFEAGTVNFSSADEGYIAITITLNPGFRFLDDPENVKVENYATAPSGNPSPGGFSDKDYADPSESSFEIIVPLNNFYGVHVDVERCADDDAEED